MQENASIYKEEDYATTYEGFDPKDPDTYIALALRQNLYLDKSLELGSLIQTQFRDRVGRKDRGVRQAGYYVISYTSMPSVLVELGFLTNPDEEDFLLSDDGKSYMASALYRALKDYRKLNTPEVAPEPTETTETQDTPLESTLVEPEGVVAPTIGFRVQIASSPVELEKSASIFQGEQEVDMYISNGQFKYTIGNFKTAEEAHEKKRALRADGFNGAFVAAFKDGERIPMSEVPK
jgi:N-acetylmuramoyl-L-alanine amidase